MKVVCIGDSLTYGFKLERTQTWPHFLSQKYNVEVLNKGISGDTTGGMLSRFQTDVIAHRPTHVIIMGGGNDFIWRVPVSVVKANIAALVFQSFSNNIIPYLGIPVPIECEMAKKYWVLMDIFPQVNEDLKELRAWALMFSQIFSCQTIDFYSQFYDFANDKVKSKYYLDGLHLTPQGNQLMAETVKF